MDEVVSDLADQHGELETLLTRLDDDDWGAPTPCPGWDVTDVVVHLAQTDEIATASARGRFHEHLEVLTGSNAADDTIRDVDAGAAALVQWDAGRDAGADAVLDRWRRSAAELRSVLSEADPTQRVDWVAGQFTARTLGVTRISECWIHTTDVAAAVGVELAPTDRLRHVARLAWRTVPYAFERAGEVLSAPVDFELTGPNGDEWSFRNEGARTVVSGPAIDLCRVAGQRGDVADTELSATGPDADAVLRLVRTFA